MFSGWQDIAAISIVAAARLSLQRGWFVLRRRRAGCGACPTCPSSEGDGKPLARLSLHHRRNGIRLATNGRTQSAVLLRLNPEDGIWWPESLWPVASGGRMTDSASRTTRYFPRTPIAACPHPISSMSAREHNLRSVDVSLPRNKLICLTGVSGSGKARWHSTRCTPGSAAIR